MSPCPRTSARMVEEMDGSLCGRGHRWPCTLGTKCVTHSGGRRIAGYVWEHSLRSMCHRNSAEEHWRSSTDPRISEVLWRGKGVVFLSHAAPRQPGSLFPSGPSTQERWMCCTEIVFCCICAECILRARDTLEISFSM